MNAPIDPAIQADREAQRAYEKYLADMPPGRERDEAIANYVRDYPGRTVGLEERISDARESFNDILDDSPEMRTGPKENPFSVSVAANPLEFLGQGLRAYNASHEMRGLEDELERERATMEGVQTDELRAILEANRRADAAARGILPEEANRRADAVANGILPEEEEERAGLSMSDLLRGRRGGNLWTT